MSGAGADATTSSKEEEIPDHEDQNLSRDLEDTQHTSLRGTEQPRGGSDTSVYRFRRTSSPSLEGSSLRSRSDPASISSRSQSDYQDSLQYEADYYNSKALQRAVIGEASRGSTRDWSLVDVPPGTYSVTLNGIGGGSQVITWQIHNGARQSRFVTNEQEFTAWADFGTSPRLEHDGDPRMRPTDMQRSLSYAPVIDVSQGVDEAHQSLNQSSLEDLLTADVAKDEPVHATVPKTRQQDDSHVIIAASHPLPASPVPSLGSEVEIVRRAPPSLEEAPPTSQAPRTVQSESRRTVRITTPDREDFISAAPSDVPAGSDTAWDETILRSASPELRTARGSEQRPEPVYEALRSPRPVRYGSGADFSSESELNPEDSVSRTMRPSSASDHRTRSGIARGQVNPLRHQKYSTQYEYEGWIFYGPKNRPIESLDQSSWGQVKRMRMPLQDRELHAEAAYRADAASTLDQFLALPSDFLRERIDDEIERHHAESLGMDQQDQRATSMWCLLGVSIEDNKLMLFLVGVPNATLVDSYKRFNADLSPPGGWSVAMPNMSSTHAVSKSERDLTSPPRPTMTPEPAGPGASADDLVSLTGAPSAVSAYRPSVRIFNRYPISEQHRNRAAPSQRGQYIAAGATLSKAATHAEGRELKRESTQQEDTFKAPSTVAVREDETSPDCGPEIQLTDAIGRKFGFPWHLARTYAGIQSLIDAALGHIEPLKSEVSKGHYDLLGPGQRVILPQLWEDLVKPGWEITMLMWPAPDQPVSGERPLHHHSPRHKGPTVRTSSGFDASLPAAGAGQVVSLVPTQTGVDRVDSAGSKYVQDLQTSTHPAPSLPETSYLGFIATLKDEMPHLTNMLATGCRNSNGGKLYCWDTLRVGERPVLTKQAGPPNWRVGGSRAMTEVLGLPTDDVKMRTIIVEDLSPAMIEWIGASLWPNPEFFEEHLAQSGYQGAESRGLLPRTWNTNITTKEYISVKWHRPVERNDLPPHTAQERHALLDLAEGLFGWTSPTDETAVIEGRNEDLEEAFHILNVDTNIFRQCWPLAADPSSYTTSNVASTTAVWEERATLYQTRMGRCPTIVILVDPLPRIRHTIQEQSIVEPSTRTELLYRQMYNRNSVGSTPDAADLLSRRSRALPDLTRTKSHLATTNGTANDLLHWLDEAAQLTPDNPDLSIVTALLWVIHRDTIGFMHIVSNILEDIGIGSTNDTLVRTHLPHWRDLISRFQVELPTLRTSLDMFARVAQEINPVEPTQSIVSEFIPETLVQIDILIEQNEKSYAALRADMGVLESRKAIAEAESVGKLTELAFIFIPLTFITGAFSMQIEELQTPAPVWAFIIAAIVAITLAYAVRLAIRSDGIADWAHAYSRRVREYSNVAEEDRLPLSQGLSYTLKQALPAILLRRLPKSLLGHSAQRTQARHVPRSHHNRRAMLNGQGAMEV